jgi:lipid-A-disaccharide synthase
MKYYLVAGERSGDLHGSNLLRALKQHDTSMHARGFGGDEMQAAGMELTVHYSKLAFMGFTAVIANLNKISALIRQCKQDIMQFKPDVIILIDYAGFNMRIAKFAKEHNLLVFYYISPKVWAWNTKRAWKLKAVVDRMFCILPFEKDFYRKFNWQVDYVGNPVLDAIRNFESDPSFPERIGLDKGKKIIALLPGSRKLELRRMIPVMAEVAKRNRDYQFVVAAVKTLPADLYKPLMKNPGVRMIFDSTYDLLTHADAAIVTSGTATLETALFRVPQAVIYKAGVVEEKLLRMLIKVKYISLVNLVADAPVVKEFIQYEMTWQNLDAELGMMLRNADYRNRMLAGYERIYKILDTGSASENAARLMFEELTTKN